MWGVKEKDMVMGDCQIYRSACVSAGELFRYAHRELDAVLRLGAQGLRPDARFAHGIDGVVYCVDKDADIFEELYTRGLCAVSLSRIALTSFSVCATFSERFMTVSVAACSLSGFSILSKARACRSVKSAEIIFSRISSGRRRSLSLFDTVDGALPSFSES